MDNIFEKLVKGNCYKLRLDYYGYDNTKGLFKLIFKIIDKECRVTKSNEQVNTDSNDEQVNTDSNDEQVNTDSNDEQVNTDSNNEQVNTDSNDEQVNTDSNNEQVNTDSNNEQVNPKLNEELQKCSVELHIPEYSLSHDEKSQDLSSRILTKSYKSSQLNKQPYIVNVNYKNKYKTMQFTIETMNDILPDYWKLIADEYGNNYSIVIKSIGFKYNEKFKPDDLSEPAYNYIRISQNSFTKGIPLLHFKQPYFVFGKFKTITNFKTITRLTEKDNLSIKERIENFFNINKKGGAPSRRANKSRKTRKSSKKSKKSGKKSRHSSRR